MRLYDRRYELIVGTGGRGLSIKNLRVQFEIEKTNDSTPNKAKFKIFNLSYENELKISKEYDEVLLNAGYKEGVGLIFRGNITSVFKHREGVDRVVEILCGDGDRAYQTAIVNETLTAGSTDKQLASRVADSMGTPIKHNSSVARPYIRGKVVSGNSRDVLDKISNKAGAIWSIQDGALQVLGAKELLPGEAWLVKPSTGMLGAPEVTDKGVKIKTLLNPSVKVGSALKLEAIDELTPKKKLAPNSKGSKDSGVTMRHETDNGSAQATKHISPDGIYKLIGVRYVGDSHGNDWYVEGLGVRL